MLISMALLMKPTQESECSMQTALISNNYHRVVLQQEALEKAKKAGQIDTKTYLQNKNELDHQANVFENRLHQIDESVESGMLVSCSDMQLLKVFKTAF